jgi:cell division protein FtsB
MRTSLIVLVAGSMLALPIVGNVQQVPGEAGRRAVTTVIELQGLMELQTEAIQALRKRVEALDARVKKLEDERAAGNSR